jgi:hypothetical protein
MAVYGKNLVNKQIREGSRFPDVKNFTPTWVSYNQGDFLIYDSTSNVVRAPSAESECVSFLGIAQVDIVSGLPRSPYNTQVDAAASLPSIAGPIYGDTFNMVLQTGTTIAPGAAIYASPVAAGTEPNTLVSATGTYQIGWYLGKSITSSTAGQVIEVAIGARWPAAASGAQYIQF